VHPVSGGVHVSGRGKERSLVASIGVVIVGLRVLARLPQGLADLGMDNPKRVADVDIDVRFDAGQRHGSGHGVGDEEQEPSTVESSDRGRSGWRLSARGGGELGPWAIDSLPVSGPHLRFIHRVGHPACLSPSPSPRFAGRADGSAVHGIHAVQSSPSVRGMGLDTAPTQYCCCLFPRPSPCWGLERSRPQPFGMLSSPEIPAIACAYSSATTSVVRKVQPSH